MSEANVARGHKANLSNPHTSEESKEHSREILENIEGGSAETTDNSGYGTIGGKDEGNVLRGHKAAMNNPNVSEEAKEHSRQVLEDNNAI